MKQERKSGAREKKKQVSQQRSEEFRRAAVEKFQNRGSRSVEEVGRVLGVSSWSLYQWSKRYGKTDVMKHQRRPGDRSVQEKLKAVIEFEGRGVEKQGEYLRREGLHSEHIAGWKKSMEVVQTCGEPPNAGSTIRPTIGCTRKSSAAARNEVRTKRVCTGPRVGAGG